MASSPQDLTSVTEIVEFQRDVERQADSLRSGCLSIEEITAFAKAVTRSAQTWAAALPLLPELREAPESPSAAVLNFLEIVATTNHLHPAPVHPPSTSYQIRLLKIQEAEARARIEGLIPSATEFQRRAIDDVVRAWKRILDGGHGAVGDCDDGSAQPRVVSLSAPSPKKTKAVVRVARRRRQPTIRNLWSLAANQGLWRVPIQTRKARIKGSSTQGPKRRENRTTHRNHHRKGRRETAGHALTRASEGAKGNTRVYTESAQPGTIGRFFSRIAAVTKAIRDRMRPAGDPEVCSQ